MDGMNRMEAGPEAAWEEDSKHRVGNAGAVREGAVVAVSLLASFPCAQRSLRETTGIRLSGLR